MAEKTTARLGDLTIDTKVNVRKAGRGAEPVFTGTIRRRGVMQELIVRRKGDKLAITDGGKRYEGLCWLRDHKESANGVPVTDDYEVPIKITDESDADARETSLILNVARSETHPVDRFERFAELVKDGATPQAIADTYGMPVREVDKALALGVLHPKLLAAWRTGEIKAEAAQAYTLSTDQKAQLKAFEKLQKSRQYNSPYWIRQEFKAGEGDVGKYLELVGREAYEARGGKVTAFDLFEGKHAVSDPKLLEEMATEKIAEECKRLVALGWGWAAPVDDMPNGWDWSWQKINPKIEFTAAETKEIERLQAICDQDDEGDNWDEVEKAEESRDRLKDAARARSFGSKQMAKSGCVIEISDDGKIEVTYGIIKPDKAKIGDVVESEQFEERRKEKTKADKKKAPSLALSNALITRLSEQLTIAAAEAVKKRRDDALDIAIAALVSDDGAFPPGVMIGHHGSGSVKMRGSFKAIFEKVQSMREAQKLDLLAEAVGASFDFTVRDSQALGRFKAAGLCDTLGKEIVVALRKAFDAADYFNSVSKAVCLAAITEAVNKDEARKISVKPKSDIAKFAIANVPKTGWLPAELRTGHYEGPGAEKPQKKKRAA